MRIAIILFISAVSLCNGITLEKTLKYGVALTTIPPRFGVLHHQLLSWLNQTITAQKIRIFIPRSYKRFRNKQSNKQVCSYTEQLVQQLHNFPLISASIHTQVIEVVEVLEDWGPLTKFVGTLVYHSTKREQTYEPVDYWIFCDDDVTYSPLLAAHYAEYIHFFRLPPTTDTLISFHSFGFTLFTSEHRLQLSLGGAGVRRVPHIQGVDSYLVPSTAFSPPPSILSQPPSSILDPTLESITDNTSNYSSLSNVTNIVRIIGRIHTQWCPESFYQDDYIASYLLYLSGAQMHSARLAHPACSDDYEYSGEEVDLSGVDCTNGISMTSSIEGVSKHIFQMHMNEKVFVREYITQQCLMAHAREVYDMLYGAK